MTKSHEASVWRYVYDIYIYIYIYIFLKKLGVFIYFKRFIKEIEMLSTENYRELKKIKSPPPSFFFF
jgi:hypothetical protein